MKDDQNVLAIVVPAYNEAEALPYTLPQLDDVLKELIKEKKISPKSFIEIVNDGSKDNTWEEIEKASKENPHITGINFSRNFGHQNALIGGLTAARPYADVFVTIDADLQDDQNAIIKMVDDYNDGYDIVYGVRSDRKTDSHFKRWTAEFYYWFMKKMGVEMIPESADFRLTSGRVVDYLLNNFKERNLFLRGIIPKIGFPYTTVDYSRKPREEGESKYPLNKMIGLAMNGITSFSVVPLQVIFWLGSLAILIALVMVGYVIYRFCVGDVVTGWSSLMLSIWFLGGVQLISLSLIGEYVGKIFTETKNRPRFIIKDNLLELKHNADQRK